MVRVFDEAAWKRTVYQIQRGRCTPFVGAGASAKHVPVAGQLAKALARQYRYPFADTRDLARVTQFAAVREGDRQFVKAKFVDDMFTNIAIPDFSASDDPYAVLAQLELPIYLTTNYDDFMFKALADHGHDPQLAICPWYTTNPKQIKEMTSLFRKPEGYNPQPGKPIVYHLHGHHSSPESLVLTEDDYIEFLVRLSGDRELLPKAIQQSLGGRMLLFVGYSLEDWTFRVIFRGLLSARPSLAQYSHVSVQLPPQAAKNPKDDRPLRIQEYLDDYFDQQRISICWQDAQEFTTELHRRLKAG